MAHVSSHRNNVCICYLHHGHRAALALLHLLVLLPCRERLPPWLPPLRRWLRPPLVRSTQLVIAT
jgi:hypothetical protein